MKALPLMALISIHLIIKRDVELAKWIEGNDVSDKKDVEEK